MGLQRFRTNKKKPDYLLALVIFALSVFGVIMVYSASVVVSYKVYGYNNYYLNKQIISLIIGVFVWIIFSNIDYRIWQKYAFWMLICTLFLLIAVFLPGIGVELGGAHRWIDVGFTLFQPSEIIKLTLIVYLAAWLAKKGEGVRDFQSGFLPFVVLIGLVVVLIMKQPDMGTMSVIASTAAIMFFVAGASLVHILLGGVSALAVFWILIRSSAYRFQRFLTFLNPTDSSLGAGYHISQALLAIGSGGLLGLGFGLSEQKHLFLPQAQTDSIFAIICEELGFIRAILVILVYVFIAWRGYKIAKNAPDMFSRLLATGVTTWIVVQALINLAAMTGLIPLTGVPLPFISYGGSSLIVLFAAVGILMNISKQSNR